MKHTEEFSHILEPIQVGSVLIPNRLLMAAHSYGYADNDGLPTDFLVEYLAERARGGVGLVIMGGTAVSKEGALPLGHITRSFNDQIIPWYKKIALAVHEHGAVVFDQLMHAGGQLRPREGIRIVGPSSISQERTRGLPVELTADEIQRIENDFIQAACRAREGGLDGVEIKCDQGFLVHQFLSPYYNRREDDYGGTYERRLAFLRNILHGIRSRVGTEFVLGVRITCDSGFPNDLGPEDALRIAQDIDRTDHVDYIHVNGATNATFIGYLTNHGDSSIPSMNFAAHAKRIKSVVRVPTMIASMIMHPAEAEHIVASGIADMAAMTRAHIADPEIVRKIKEGRVRDIRPCITCNQGCVGNHYGGFPVRCIHNPAAGRERELGTGTLTPVTDRKVIAIVGGGVAGLEVARVAATRGHEVHLFEKQKTLGGQLLLAGKLPYRQGMMDIVHYLEAQIRKLGVHVHRSTYITVDNLEAMSADLDSIVIATGSKFHIPPQYQEVDPVRVLTIEQMLNETVPLGKDIIVVDTDWRQNALGIAEWLVQRNRNVTIISSAYYACDLMDIATVSSYYSRLWNRVRFMPLTDVVELKDRAAVVRNVLNNERMTLHPIDQVVFVTGALPNRSLYMEASKRLRNVYQVGDCVNPLGIPEAMLDANRLARIL